ncbi:MAG: excinuclease ABC subunit UvrB [Clostridia bacterium]|nr:excinuclease ABC subunit UvrB [Clostridia bacterium]
MGDFKLSSKFAPTGDQPEAIDALCRGLDAGISEQTLLGVTGSGKTFTMANIIARHNRPTLVLAHNKTLAAQLCAEFREFFPENAVEYFVSYFDYYQPEAYIPSTDTYIEKDSSTNEEIDRLRHSATSALFERRDVIVVASVSCIYGLGDPVDYGKLVISLRPGMQMERDTLIRRLVANRFDRNDVAIGRNRFRVRGDTVELMPSWSESRLIRVEFFGDEIDRLSEVDPLTGRPIRTLNHAAIYPANHFITTDDKMEIALKNIEAEFIEREKYFLDNGMYLEAERIRQRTTYDLEMMREIGYCSGIENYSRQLDGRAAGTPPWTLMDYFPKDFLMFVDESHVSLPQVRGMYAGDRARKENLVRYGFRLPSALDNRPLTFTEFEERIHQVIYVSATPAEYETTRSGQIAEQVIRPTGLLDPEVEIRPVEGQVDDLIGEIRLREERGERVLVTTLTKKMAEDLTAYMEQIGIRVRYMHHQVDNMERMALIRDLRLGKFDVLIGINLLREGLDIPEVSLVAVLDADQEGFLRSETSLVQIIGRAARNAEGRVILYADRMTDSIRGAVEETDRRRKIQRAYNEAHGIVPKTIIKEVRDVLSIGAAEEQQDPDAAPMTEEARRERIAALTAEMKTAAQNLEFEYAAELRDRIIRLQDRKEPGKGRRRGRK